MGKWHSGVHDRRYHPNQRGFGEFAGFLSGIMDYWNWFLDYNGSSRRADGRYQTDVFTAEAVDFIRRCRAAPGTAARQPFLLVVAYHAPHAPLQAPEESCAPFRQRGDLNQALATMYGMVAHMDRGIGQILDTLEATGCAGDTVVLVTSDNGPHLGPERYGGRRFSMERFNGPFRGQKQDVLEGGIRVPAIVRWPDGLPAGAACDVMIHFCDWLPTLASRRGRCAGWAAAGRLRSVAGVARHHPRRRRAALLAVQPLRSGARLQPGAARRPLEAVLAAHPGSNGQAAGGQRGGARADGAPALRDGGAQSAGGAHAFGTGRAGVVPHPRRPLRGAQPGRRTSRPRHPHASGGRELVRRGGGGAPGDRRTVVTGGVIVGRPVCDDATRRSAMIYDMRIYDVQPGAVPRYMEAVREVALKIREDHGVKLAGWYYTDIGPLNRIVHIWAYRDYAHFEEAREAVRNDPRWSGEYLPRVKGLVVRQQDMMMRGADFFPGPA